MSVDLQNISHSLVRAEAREEARREVRQEINKQEQKTDQQAQQVTQQSDVDTARRSSTLKKEQTENRRSQQGKTSTQKPNPQKEIPDRFSQQGRGQKARVRQSSQEADQFRKTETKQPDSRLEKALSGRQGKPEPLQVPNNPGIKLSKNEEQALADKNTFIRQDPDTSEKPKKTESISSQVLTPHEHSMEAAKRPSEVSVETEGRQMSQELHETLGTSLMVETPEVKELLQQLQEPQLFPEVKEDVLEKLQALLSKTLPGATPQKKAKIEKTLKLIQKYLQQIKTAQHNQAPKRESILESRKARGTQNFCFANKQEAENASLIKQQQVFKNAYCDLVMKGNGTFSGSIMHAVAQAKAGGYDGETNHSDKSKDSFSISEGDPSLRGSSQSPLPHHKRVMSLGRFRSGIRA